MKTHVSIVVASCHQITKGDSCTLLVPWFFLHKICCLEEPEMLVSWLAKECLKAQNRNWAAWQGIMGPLGNMLGIPKTKTVSQKTLSWFFRWEGCVGVPPMAPWATCWTQKARVPKAVAPSQGCSPSVSQASGNHWDCTCSSPLWLATLKNLTQNIREKYWYITYLGMGWSANPKYKTRFIGDLFRHPCVSTRIIVHGQVLRWTRSKKGA